MAGAINRRALLEVGAGAVEAASIDSRMCVRQLGEDGICIDKRMNPSEERTCLLI